ncbi:hypothetical protein PILCRDRAFT_810432 [Piloderma croceum F 1598]|uniref:Dynamin N-terminal domain-containing protein n=1 Tax=Piloderma croceum (strain F 1598) TaxID=765440 RepID=A0A0C3CRS2_PILCF|nr:hypothetical protein PILCRDRAFT_810432 [Piloderma croceum F 1598]
MADAILRDLLLRNMPEPVIAPVQRPSVAENTLTLIRQYVDRLAKILDGTEQQPWKEEAKRLCDEAVLQPITGVLAGRTGAGKSTVANAVMQNRLLPSSSEVACTSVITIISFVDDLNFLTASVFFISKEKFCKFLQTIIGDRRLEWEVTGDIASYTTAAEGQAIILALYPHLKNSYDPRSSDYDVDILLNHESIGHLLDDSCEITARNSNELQDKLRGYLTPQVNSPGGPALWHIVDHVHIKARVDALSTGLRVIDIPGYGDANKNRNDCAEEYLVKADCVFLVVDIKRAKDDKDMPDFLEKSLRHAIVDGRAGEGSLVLIVTGADVPSGDNEVTLDNENDNRTVAYHTQTALRISQEIIDYQNASNQLNMLINTSSDPTTRQTYHDGLDKLDDEINARKCHLSDINIAKNKIVANARNITVSQHLQEIYCRTYREVLNDATVDPPHIPTFCVGSRDFLSLSGLESTQSLVFQHKDETSIPKLTEYMKKLGERRQLTHSALLVNQAQKLLGQAEVYFESRAKQDETLQAYVKSAARVLQDLDDRHNKVIDGVTQEIRCQLDSLEGNLAAAARTAATRSIRMFESLPDIHRWNTFVAIMRREGEWKDVDFNEELTEGIFPDVVKCWNRVMNRCIPSLLKRYRRDISAATNKALASLGKASDACDAVKQQISGACQLIGVDAEMMRADTACRRALALQQREANRSFKKTVRHQILPHYRKVAAFTGKGAYARIKEENSKFIKKNHLEVFDAVNVKARKLFEEIYKALLRYMKHAVLQIHTAIATSLVQVQTSPVLVNIKNQRLPVMRDLMNTAMPSLERLTQDIETRLKAIS